MTSDDPQVLRLVEEIMDSGRTLQDVCSEYPELAGEVRERFDRCRRFERELDAIFPPSEASAPGIRWRIGPAQTGLPQIPGYEVLSVLGRGGMGVVYKARHLKLNRVVALKMLLAGGYASESELARFGREAEALAALHHANLVQVYDSGELDGCPYFTMEFVDGGHLGQKLGGFPQPAREAAEFVAALALAVDAAHRAGIVHRDLKPANVLLSADGTPKVSDFGLARRADGESALTISGARVGTPSYMAPEQALGRTGTIGRPTDVYALGAILYEMLTGRPPFRGESAADTQRQLLAQEPVPPSRLNGRVPRDLETICLKCLRKEPQRRYASAAALGDDLRRFLNAEPISARPVGLAERGVRWARRHPTAVTAMAGAAAIAIVLAGVALSLVMRRAELRHAVGADLAEVTRLQEQARWTAAQAALDRAEARLGDGGHSELRPRFAAARRDLDLVMKLDAIRLVRVTQGELAMYKTRANDNYDRAFGAAGLMGPANPPSLVAARVRESAIRPALVAALDDWILCCPDADARARLVDIVCQADPDESGWRARILAPATWNDREALATLARDVPVSGESPSLLLTLGERIRNMDGEPSAFLARVQAEHPADFWANLILGNALLFRAPADACGYYRAALASRPEAAVSYCAVGDALREQRDYDEALRYFGRAVRADPTYARAYTNIGLTLQKTGDLDAAIENYRKAIPLDPDYAWTYFELANALTEKGRFDEASEDYRRAIALDPSNKSAADGERGMLIRRGRAEDVWNAWRNALDKKPDDLDDWIGYGELSLFLGRQDEYERARHEMLARFGNDTDPAECERTSRACLLLPLGGDALRKAVALADRAVAAKDSTEPFQYRYFLFAKGLANYREGRLDEAIALMEGGAAKISGPGPRLVLAMARWRRGEAAAARQALAEAVRRRDWSPEAADHRDAWIWHALRREAKQMILPDSSSELDAASGRVPNRADARHSTIADPKR